MTRYASRTPGDKVTATLRLDPEKYRNAVEIADAMGASFNTYVDLLIAADIGRYLDWARKINAAKAPVTDNRRTVIDRLAGKDTP